MVYDSLGLDMYVNDHRTDTSRNGGLLMHSEKFSFFDNLLKNESLNSEFRVRGKLVLVKAVLYPRKTKWFSLQNIEFSSKESLVDRKRTTHLFVFNMDQLNAFIGKMPRVAFKHEDESSDSCEGRDPQQLQITQVSFRCENCAVNESLCKVIQPYNIERSSDILVIDDDIKWDYIGLNAVQELKCGSFSKTQNQIAVWIKFDSQSFASFDLAQCVDFKELGYICSVYVRVHSDDE